jgi:hypothetical protein
MDQLPSKVRRLRMSLEGGRELARSRQRKQKEKSHAASRSLSSRIVLDLRPTPDASSLQQIVYLLSPAG